MIFLAVVTKINQAAGSLVIMASDFGTKGSNPDVTKDPPSACGVRARKIRGSEFPEVGHWQFAIDVISRRNFPPFQRHIKIMEVEMDVAAI